MADSATITAAQRQMFGYLVGDTAFTSAISDGNRASTQAGEYGRLGAEYKDGQISLTKGNGYDVNERAFINAMKAKGFTVDPNALSISPADVSNDVYAGMSQRLQNSIDSARADGRETIRIGNKTLPVSEVENTLQAFAAERAPAGTDFPKHKLSDHLENQRSSLQGRNIEYQIDPETGKGHVLIKNVEIQAQGQGQLGMQPKTASARVPVTITEGPNGTHSMQFDVGGTQFVDSNGTAHTLEKGANQVNQQAFGRVRNGLQTFSEHAGAPVGVEAFGNKDSALSGKPAIPVSPQNLNTSVEKHAAARATAQQAVNTAAREAEVDRRVLADAGVELPPERTAATPDDVLRERAAGNKDFERILTQEPPSRPAPAATTAAGDDFSRLMKGAFTPGASADASLKELLKGSFKPQEDAAKYTGGDELLAKANATPAPEQPSTPEPHTTPDPRARLGGNGQLGLGEGMRLGGTARTAPQAAPAAAAEAPAAPKVEEPKQLPPEAIAAMDAQRENTLRQLAAIDRPHSLDNAVQTGLDWRMAPNGQMAGVEINGSLSDDQRAAIARMEKAGVGSRQTYKEGKEYFVITETPDNKAISDLRAAVSREAAGGIGMWGDMGNGQHTAPFNPQNQNHRNMAQLGMVEVRPNQIGSHSMIMNGDWHGYVSSVAQEQAKARQADMLEQRRAAMAQSGRGSAGNGVADGAYTAHGSATHAPATSDRASGPRASLDTSSEPAAAANADSLKKGHAEVIDQGNLAVKPKPAPAQADKLHLQDGKTSDVGKRTAPANDAAPKLQSGTSSNVSAKHGAAANDAHTPPSAGGGRGDAASYAQYDAKAAAAAHAKPAHTVTAPHEPTAKAAPHVETPHAKAPSKAGRAGGLVATVAIAGAAAYSAEAGKKLDAALSTIPGVEEIKKGNYASGAVQAVGSLDPTMGYGESLLNKGARAAGVNVPQSAMEEAVSKGGIQIPQKVLNEDIRMSRVGKGMLRDAGLQDYKGRDGQTVSPEAMLRNPASRENFMRQLEDQAKHATGPAKDKAEFAVQAAKDFVGIADRQAKHREPHRQEFAKLEALSGSMKDNGVAAVKTDAPPAHVIAGAKPAPAQGAARG